MTDFGTRVAGLNTLATSRLGGETWELAGTSVTAIYDERYAKVNFGDDRYKNVDMSGVGINATAPVVKLPTEDVPYGLTRGDEAMRMATMEQFSIVSIEDDNGMSVVRLRSETD